VAIVLHVSSVMRYALSARSGSQLSDGLFDGRQHATTACTSSSREMQNGANAAPFPDQKWPA
jgi:hypothetical protein